MSTLIIQLAFIVIGALAGIYIPSGIVYSDFEPVIDGLQDISVMVFTIMGIWVAFLYPSAMQAVTDPDKVAVIDSGENTTRLEDLITAILISAFVLLALLCFTYGHMLIKGTDFYKNESARVISFSVSYITYLCLVQSKAVFSVIVSNIRFINKLHSHRNEQLLKKDLN
ncbi:hypothetical protein [Marinobacterium stanieri]|uniref:hypothetical protein n=1 Tax=Marinobacterium stanieri TaxID=49186 RepID=UPI003A8FBFB7